MFCERTMIFCQTRKQLGKKTLNVMSKNVGGLAGMGSHVHAFSCTMGYLVHTAWMISKNMLLIVLNVGVHTYTVIFQANLLPLCQITSAAIFMGNHVDVIRRCERNLSHWVWMLLKMIFYPLNVFGQLRKKTRYTSEDNFSNTWKI